jgi:hypothetical protein
MAAFDRFNQWLKKKPVWQNEAKFFSQFIPAGAVPRLERVADGIVAQSTS